MSRRNAKNQLAGNAAFPLTLALSLGERGQVAMGFVFSGGHPANPTAGYFREAATMPLLPVGEGWDEGKAAKKSTRFSMANGRS
jgi:hypothetical protein